MKIEYRCEFWYEGSSKHDKLIEEKNMPRNAICKCGQSMHIKILERYCPICGQESLHFGNSQFKAEDPIVLCTVCFDSFLLRKSLTKKPDHSELLLKNAKRKKSLEDERDEMEDEIDDLNEKIAKLE